MCSDAIVNVFGLLEGTPGLPRLKIWDPRELSDGQPVVSPIIDEGGDPDFLTRVGEGRLRLDGIPPIEWLLEERKMPTTVRRQITVRFGTTPEGVRLVSSTTHQPADLLRFTQVIAVALYVPDVGNRQRYGWHLD